MVRHDEFCVVFGKLMGGVKIENIIYRHKGNKLYFQ